MPQKRPKRPVIREQEKAQRPIDLAPKISIEHEPIPKSFSRVLNAEQIRREYRKKKHQLEGAGNSDEDNVPSKRRCRNVSDVKDGGEKTALKIKPGETVPEFNRRVENNMMPLIKTALRRSSARTRTVRKEEVAQKMFKRDEKTRKSLPESLKSGSRQPPTIDSGTVNPWNATKEFQKVSTSAPRRLNDIAQEPPVIKQLPRGTTRNHAIPSGVLSMAQKAMMEVERDRAIRHYREMKARKLREAGGGVKLGGSDTEYPHISGKEKETAFQLSDLT